MLKLKLNRQYFGHLMQRNESLEMTLTLGKIESRTHDLSSNSQLVEAKSCVKPFYQLQHRFLVGAQTKQEWFRLVLVRVQVESGLAVGGSW